MAAALMEADPEHGELYQANYRAFAGELAALDRELAALFDPLPGSRTFLVFHPAWAYLARAYGLEELAIETDGKEPGPRTLGAIITRAKEEGVTAVFIQPGFSRRTAQTVADALGVEVMEADVLSADWAENLRSVARKMNRAMGGK